MKRKLADIGLSTVLALASGAVGFDVFMASRLSALCVSAAMWATILWIARDAGLRLGGARLSGLWHLARVEVGLLAACVGFAVARTMLALRILGGPLLSPENEAARLYDLLFLGLALFAALALMKFPAFARWLLRLGRRPPLLLATSFALMILVATLLLCLPFSVESFEDVDPLSALFTATSAVCVTGLAVNDIGTTYTPFGQAVILLAIQFGGIGIMTIAAIAISLRSDSSLDAQAQYASLFDAGSLGELRGQIYTICSTTFAIEALGAFVLWLHWSDSPELAGRSVVWLAVFHAISAFCNAGFSLFPDNLMRFSSDGVTQLVVMVLIVTGGIGFPVYHALLRRAKARVISWLDREAPPLPRYDLATRTVARTTAILIFGGAAAVLALEAAGAFRGLGWGDRLWAALFTSVTTRTAGFNTLDFATLSETAVLLVLALMFIGGSPGSTAGGVKTTTVAVLFATFRAELRGADPSLGTRAISPATIRRASAVTAISLVLIAFFLGLLTLTEERPLIELAFETVSAFATVGLSLGCTPELSSLGRLVIVCAMFVGRIGPMGIALAVGDARERRSYKLPEAELQIW
jgi:trk system potassium uptake protein TrkH